MKTPNLFDVPKDRPTRKELLKAFKLQHGIRTHDANNGDDQTRWLAVLFDECWQRWSVYCDGDKTVMGLMMGACRLVDEAEFSGYGRTEIDAIRQLCASNKIQCPL